jgi:hypothetical protein
MDLNWAIEVLGSKWDIVMSAPAILGAAFVLGLFLGWGAAWLILHKRLAHYRERLDDYRGQILKIQNELTGAAASDLFDHSELQLVIHGDEREPTLVFYMNISSWYFLRQVLEGIDKETGKKAAEHVTISLFVLFNQPTKAGTLEIKADTALPPHEVKEFNDRFAIIIFSDQIPACTLEITTR